MSDKTPAEELRAAAKAMRERATAATPGPWRPVAGTWQAETFHAVIGAKGVPEDARTWLMATGRGCREADAGHAASWHPVVALAVADWLDNEAAATELCTDPYDTAGTIGLPDVNAVAVARAYLGSSE